jgi:hypothetical protein
MNNLSRQMVWKDGVLTPVSETLSPLTFSMFAFDAMTEQRIADAEVIVEPSICNRSEWFVGLRETKRFHDVLAFARVATREEADALAANIRDLFLLRLTDSTGA